MINNVDRQVAPEVKIPSISIEKMGITPDELDSISQTLTDFTDTYNKNWRTFKITQKTNLVNATLEFNKSLGVESPNEAYNNGVGSSFLVIWNHDGKRPQSSIDVWFARGTAVTGTGDEKGLRVHFLKIGSMEHGQGRLTSEKIAGERTGDWTIAFNAQALIPLAK